MSRIAVIGAGAMGAVYGAALAEAGADTVLVDVSEAVATAIGRDGVVILRDGVERQVPVSVTTDAKQAGIADIVIFFTKCYHTRAAAQSAAPVVGDETAIVSLQNGWGNGDVLVEIYGPRRVCIGVSYHSATSRGPGRVAHTAQGPTLLGAWDGNGSLADRVGATLADAGLQVEVTGGVRDEIWRKLTLNAAALPTSALTGLAAEQLVEPGDLLDLVDALAREAAAVGRANGFEVDANERIDAIHAALQRAGSGKASMLQDIEAGRRTEVDVINGAVVRLGGEAGVATPMNSAMVGLIDGYERGHGLK